MDQALKAVQAVETKMMRTMEPTHDWVVCALVTEPRLSPGGLHLPDVEVAGSNQQELEVVAAGPDTPSGLMPGDRVKIVGKAPEFLCDGDKYYLALDAVMGSRQLEKANIGNQIEFLPMGPPYIVAVLRKSRQADA